ncbi:twin-arginine translocase TatA/TatE family subunit [Natronomonas sp. F2-12]|jgi:sec-independent protein translocase protein TatA|uniref:Sec-independent protein translocase protein TatA n=1 Tax=Natronomonas aquatica TaxID=2841590 RepID=A0A9R1CR95_9EURY|nr:twin-arginine translocase TatA/TatE family subunit [Natronomonas aquatica]MCQ4332430.1 twin-arginine translocase TatA/TatE family subunit [Natronomonas aquatica]
MTTLLFIGGLGPPELLLIAGVLILLFGASKLPKLARSMGSATGEFKKGRQQVEEELEEIQKGVDPTADIEPDTTTQSTGTEPQTDDEADREPDPDAEQTGA